MIKIIDGPSKFDLMASLFDSKTVNFTPQIEILTPQKLRASVVSVEKEGSSKDSWNIKICVIDTSNPSIPIGEIIPAYYNSRNRKGSIKIKIETSAIEVVMAFHRSPGIRCYCECGRVTVENLVSLKKEIQRVAFSKEAKEYFGKEVFNETKKGEMELSIGAWDPSSECIKSWYSLSELPEAILEDLSSYDLLIAFHVAK
jgi:hypothetical protein